MYLKHLVEAISISPSNECMLRDPQILLDSALTNGDDDPSQEVEQVRRAFCLLCSRFLHETHEKMIINTAICVGRILPRIRLSLA